MGRGAITLEHCRSLRIGVELLALKCPSVNALSIIYHTENRERSVGAWRVTVHLDFSACIMSCCSSNQNKISKLDGKELLLGLVETWLK